MSADIVLTGYDRKTEILATIAVVPPRLIGSARHIAAVPATDPNVLGVYPLDATQAVALGRLAHSALDLDRYEYCLEAIARDGHLGAGHTDGRVAAFG